MSNQLDRVISVKKDFCDYIYIYICIVFIELQYMKVYYCVCTLECDKSLRCWAWKWNNKRETTEDRGIYDGRQWN